LLFCPEFFVKGIAMANENSKSPDNQAARRFDQLSGTHKTQVRKSISAPIPRPSPDMPPELQRAMEEARQQQRTAREQEIQRYQPASTAYLSAMVKNADRAAEVWEGVIEKWLEGKLSGYDPAQSFRSYLKGVLRNAVFTHSRNRRRAVEQAMQQFEDEHEVAGALESAASMAFDQRLKEDLMERTLSSMREENSQQHDAIRMMMTAVANNSDPPSSRELAQVLSRQSGTSVSDEAARQIKSRARERFPRELIRQTQQMTGSSDLDRLEETLADLGLLVYCEKTLRKMRDQRDKQDQQGSSHSS
jgi:DNA-directed RNA polymerase specialized sigma24 family protein